MVETFVTVFASFKYSIVLTIVCPRLPWRCLCKSVADMVKEGKSRRRRIHRVFRGGGGFKPKTDASDVAAHKVSTSGALETWLTGELPDRQRAEFVLLTITKFASLSHRLSDRGGKKTRRSLCLHLFVCLFTAIFPAIVCAHDIRDSLSPAKRGSHMLQTHKFDRKGILFSPVREFSTSLNATWQFSDVPLVLEQTWISTSSITGSANDGGESTPIMPASTDTEEFASWH